jgi:hypothetical protein
MSSSLAQLQDRLADPDLGAERDRGGLRDADGPDVGAVGGPEVLDEPLVAGGGDPGVPRGDVVVLEADRGVGAAPDQDRGVVERGGGAVVGAGRDDDLGRGAAARAASGTRAPNMSERITEIADSTKIQRIAR